MKWIVNEDVKVKQIRMNEPTRMLILLLFFRFVLCLFLLFGVCPSCWGEREGWRGPVCQIIVWFLQFVQKPFVKMINGIHFRIICDVDTLWTLRIIVKCIGWSDNLCRTRLQKTIRKMHSANPRRHQWFFRLFWRKNQIESSFFFLPISWGE